MNKNMKLLLLAVLLIALIAGAAVLYDQLKDTVDSDQLATEPSETNPDPSDSKQLQAAPDFTVFGTDGQTHKLSDFKGKPVVLNFWASWCGPCKSEMPAFQEAYEKYGQQIHFLMVNCTTSGRETMANAKKLISDEGYTFPVYYDTSGEAANTYGTYSIPMTFFIDAEGNLLAYGQGALNAAVLQKGIDMICNTKE